MGRLWKMLVPALLASVALAPSAGSAQPPQIGGAFFRAVGAGETYRVSLGPFASRITVVGQLTVDNATRPGFVTAWDCEGPRPSNSDLNYIGGANPVASNRLIVRTGSNGDICFYTSERADLIVDINGGTNEFDPVANVRFDTRTSGGPIAAGDTYRVTLPPEAWDKVSIGQLTVDGATTSGFVTAWNCDGPPPLKSDLNFTGSVSPIASNRLIVPQSAQGEICFYTSARAHLIVDINGKTDEIDPVPETDPATNTPNVMRFDTRTSGQPVAAGQVHRIQLGSYASDETIIGQLTVDGATRPGHITAWNCEGPRPSNSDLNYIGLVQPIASNRLIVAANSSAEVCFHTLEQVHIIVDVVGSTNDVLTVPNVRYDTRTS